jgi:hypothetical protein
MLLTKLMTVFSASVIFSEKGSHLNAMERFYIYKEATITNQMTNTPNFSK